MILGLLYKVKKNRALALQHLTEAKRIFLAIRAITPILARVETALAEFGQLAYTLRYATPTPPATPSPPSDRACRTPP